MSEQITPGESPRPAVGGGFGSRSALTNKLLIVLGLAGVLSLSLWVVHALQTERSGRRVEAVAEITSTWGREQTIVGPVLTVPYVVETRSLEDQFVAGVVQKVEVVRRETAVAQFLPARLEIAGELAPAVRYRGIYEAVVYRGTLTMHGEFARPDFGSWGVTEDAVAWDEAIVSFAITDLRGTREALTLDWGGRSVPMLPGSRLDGLPGGIHGRVPAPASGAGAIPFALTVSVNGSGAIRFAPLGTETTARIRSTWPDPSFVGAFLPTRREVTEGGFDAAWQVSFYGRSYPQQWSSADDHTSLRAAAASATHFGVSLLVVVDGYRLVERSLKYGVLFIVLVFGAFFLFEVLAGIRVHPFQYALVGLALCLFYVALLSLSEVIAFDLAYTVGAAAATLMVALYCLRALRSRRNALIVAAEMVVIYGFLYVVLRLQDYSLLLGSAGLFLALGLLMYLTRNVDWYARDES